MIAALIAAIASVIVALIGLWNRKAVKQSTAQNSVEHALVIDALQSLNGRVVQVHDMIYDHVTDREIHRP